MAALSCATDAEAGIELCCNECDAVVVSGRENVEAYVAQILGDPTIVAMDVCPHRGALNTFPEFETVLAHVCNECGETSIFADA